MNHGVRSLTSYIANDLELYGVFAGENRHYTYPNGHEVYCTDIVYVCHELTDSGEPYDDEVTEIKWFPFNNLPGNMASSVKDIIEKYVLEVTA